MHFTLTCFINVMLNVGLMMKRLAFSKIIYYLLVLYIYRFPPKYVNKC